MVEPFNNLYWSINWNSFEETRKVLSIGSPSVRE
jgi:hypothetical protein